MTDQPDTIDQMARAWERRVRTSEAADKMLAVLREVVVQFAMIQEPDRSDYLGSIPRWYEAMSCGSIAHAKALIAHIDGGI